MVPEIPIVRWDLAILEWGTYIEGNWLTPGGEFLASNLDHRYISQFIQLDAWDPFFLYAVLAGGATWHRNEEDSWAHLRCSVNNLNIAQQIAFQRLYDQKDIEIEEMAVYFCDMEPSGPTVVQTVEIRESYLIKLFLTDIVQFNQLKEIEDYEIYVQIKDV